MQSGAIFAQPRMVQSQSARAVQPEQWSTGLCDCYKDGSDCCFALWCFPLFACRTSSAAGACPCLPLLDCIGCVPPGALAVRAAVREHYGIEGNMWSDCFYACCCYPLSWCQVSREIKRRCASTQHSRSTPHAHRYRALTSLQGAHHL